MEKENPVFEGYMAIDFERFLEWAESRFDTVRIKGNEIKVNSPFYEEANGEKDYKCKLWCNPTGGKKERDNGVFHCWRTGRKGSLISLVMLVDGCSFEDALATLGTEDTSLADLEAKLAEIFDKKEEEKTIEEKLEGFQLPPYTFLISDLSPNNFYRISAEVYLFTRSLSIDRLYVCTGDDPPKYKGYKNRIVIPYYDNKGQLIYYNCRSLKEKDFFSKYMGPPLGTNILKGDVIYMPIWAEEGSKVYYTEGEFDAMAIVKAGLFAGAFGGKAISETQAQYIRPYRPILCLDNDVAGRDALPEVGDSLLAQGITNIHYVFPPKNCKDWNEMLIKYGPRILAAYLEGSGNVYSSDYSLMRKIEAI